MLHPHFCMIVCKESYADKENFLFICNYLIFIKIFIIFVT
nr:MAG TPA: hypothetical protein [Caudoviricetes sp.]